jgi:kinesin family protein 18/19
MQVAVRVRPLSPKELETSDYIVEVNHEEGELVVLDPSDATADAVDVLHRSYERAFNFKHMFGPSSTQTEVYDETIRDFIPFVLQGYNATVFAYGATGSGKTYTMLGTPRNPGLQWLAVRDLFDRVRAGEGTSSSAKVYTAYVEVYNEKIRDLFAPSNRQLALRESAERGVIIAGVKEFEVKSVEELANLLLQGNSRRMQSATAANATSSRSHAVLQIYVRKTNAKPKRRGGRRQRLGGPTTQVTPQSKLCMVDLAGSERAAKTQNRGIRLTEGAQINRSLLSLGKCINALVAKGGGNSKKHVPYRESKLTRMLKDSLGGNCRTCMIASVKPHASSFKESLNTLKYAAHAMNIKTKVRQVVKVAAAVEKFKAGAVAKRQSAAQRRAPRSVAAPQREMALPVVSPVITRQGVLMQSTRRTASPAHASSPYERTYRAPRAISPMLATKKVRRARVCCRRPSAAAR